MEKYHIIEVDGFMRCCVSIQNKADPYGTPKEFTKAEALHWIDRHTYKGMSFHYELKRVKL